MGGKTLLCVLVQIKYAVKKNAGLADRHLIMQWEKPDALIAIREHPEAGKVFQALRWLLHAQ